MGHSKGWLPTVSEIAEQNPESSVFSFGISFSAVILFSIVHIEHKKMRGWLLQSSVVDLADNANFYGRLNSISVIFGYLASFTLTIIGNFSYTYFFYLHSAAGVIFAISWIIYQFVIARLFIVCCSPLANQKLSRGSMWFKLILSGISLTFFILWIILLVIKEVSSGVAFVEYLFFITTMIFVGLFSKDFGISDTALFQLRGQEEDDDNVKELLFVNEDESF